MPEFILLIRDDESNKAFSALDEFTQGYIEAMFFTATSESAEADADENHAMPLRHDAGFDDLAPESLANIINACAAFQADNADDLAEACDNGRINGYGMRDAGRDFWYTREGHGVGFWDRDLGDVGDSLSAAAKAYGAADVYTGDDGRIYHP